MVDFRKNNHGFVPEYQVTSLTMWNGLHNKKYLELLDCFIGPKLNQNIGKITTKSWSCLFVAKVEPTDDHKWNIKFKVNISIKWGMGKNRRNCLSLTISNVHVLHNNFTKKHWFFRLLFTNMLYDSQLYTISLLLVIQLDLMRTMGYSINRHIWCWQKIELGSLGPTVIKPVWSSTFQEHVGLKLSHENKYSGNYGHLLRFDVRVNKSVVTYLLIFAFSQTHWLTDMSE